MKAGKAFLFLLPLALLVVSCPTDPGTDPGSGHQYALGDIGPGGGIIFHVVPEGFTVLGNGSPADLVGIDVGFEEYTAHYLEVATENANTGDVRWGVSSGNTLIGNGLTTYAGPSEITTDINNKVIGNGRKDTQIIIAELGTSLEYAARLAAGYTTNGGLTADWFLPSITELELLYRQWEGAGMPADYYLTTSIDVYSSSQNDVTRVWGQRFSLNSQGIYTKNSLLTTCFVRAIRAF